MVIIIMGAIGIATADPPSGCVCTGSRARGGCTTAGCSVGNDTDCTHGYSYTSSGS
ncbi:unnamed protein product, partial [Rotaria socialis]